MSTEGQKTAVLRPFVVSEVEEPAPVDLTGENLYRSGLHAVDEFGIEAGRTWLNVVTHRRIVDGRYEFGWQLPEAHDRLPP